MLVHILVLVAGYQTCMHFIYVVLPPLPCMHEPYSDYNSIILLVILSGGWLSASCPHNIVYAVKFVLRAEGPRDYIDILLSMEHQPTIVIVDMAHMVVAHGKHRKPGMFAPFDGRLVEATTENIEKAEANRLNVEMPWITDGWNEQPMPINRDHQYTIAPHPITGQFDHYCLFDTFHEGNTTQRKEVLRRTKFVPQLSGLINTQAEEQLYSAYTRDCYFMDRMSSTNHIFILRSNLDIRNERLNNRAEAKIRKDTKLTVKEGKSGRLIATKGIELLQSA